MEIDPLREIRNIRRRISNESGDDPNRVFAFYVAHQETMQASGKFTFITEPVDRESTGMATEQSDAPKSPVVREAKS